MPISQTNSDDTPQTDTPPWRFRLSDLRPFDIFLLVVATIGVIGTVYAVIAVGVVPLPNKEKAKITTGQSMSE